MPCSQGETKRYKFSIIVPVLDEQEQINSCLDALRAQGREEERQIVVVDGDPQGSTVRLIHDDLVIRVTSGKGRGRQMNVGAALADGEILLFLHADVRLPPDALDKIRSVMETGRYVGGAFNLGIDSRRLFLRYIAFRANMRSRSNRIPYGDQAIFVAREYFQKIGGFREIPIMEDVDLMRRIKKDGGRIRILRDKVMASARRWEAEGPLYTTVRNQVIVGLYYLGVSPEKLVRFYRAQSRIRARETGIGFSRTEHSNM